VDCASANQSAALGRIGPRRASALAAKAAPILFVLLGGCGRDESETTGAQLAARVNSDAISAQDVEAALKRSSATALDAPVKRAIVDKLIEQRLAMQRALEKRLDSAPQVAQALEAARSEILARAYLEQVASAHSGPSPEEVTRYYAEHPALFAQRRIYTLEEIALGRQPALGAALKERWAMGQSFEEIASWLESGAVRYTLNRGSRAAEQVPLDILPTLHAMKDGEMRLIETAADSLVVVRLLGSRLAPIDEATAAPLIREFLRKRRSSEAIAAEMKRLRQGARIQYADEFQK
jgi:EpsD family peptidyl-prolyl cis-trans isomerase